MSGLSIKRDVAGATVTNRAYLPSDSEEDDDDDDDENTDDDDDIKDVPEVIKGNTALYYCFYVNTEEYYFLDQRPISLNQKSRPHSIESVRDDISTPSRGSNSSHISPLTDEDEAPSPTQHQRIRNINAIPPIKDEYIYHRPPQSKQNTNSNNRPMSMNMIDPIHYQRMQLYQSQLQYQQQIQYQQAMALQQQQNLYLLSQSPSAFFPPGARVIDDYTSPPRIKRHSTGHTSPSGKGHKHHNIMNSTDARRRAEMMKNATDAANKKPSQYHSQPFHTPVIKSNNHSRSPSRNI